MNQFHDMQDMLDVKFMRLNADRGRPCGYLDSFRNRCPEGSFWTLMGPFENLTRIPKMSYGCLSLIGESGESGESLVQSTANKVSDHNIYGRYFL